MERKDQQTQHHMTRRAAAHDYSRPGIYHITMHVTEEAGMPLGTVVGTDADTASMSLTPSGEAVRQELLTAITTHYGMVTVDAYVIMPEHLHFILIVRDNIVSQSGRPAHLGQVIAGFKKGCNRRYWVLTGAGPGALPGADAQAAPGAQAGHAQTGPGAQAGHAQTGHAQTGHAQAGKPLDTLRASVAGGLPAGALVGAPAAAPAVLAPAVLGPAAAAAPRRRPPSGGSSGRAPLFAPGYCDVMPIEPGQLDTQRAYIRNNPRSRWLRTHNRAVLYAQRGGLDTAVTPAALRGYLQRECPPKLVTPDVLAAIERRLLLAGRTITCDSYGDRSLLERRLLPVVCHRRDTKRFYAQKRRCLDEAAAGTVLVSACISPHEREIIDETVDRGFPAIIIADNGFPSVYHPSTQRIDLCAEGRLLIVTPWQYQYRGKNEAVTVPYCKTMNCIAQAISRTKDSWWQTYQES